MKKKKSQQLVPFSQCDFWGKQKEFYTEEGINAWVDKIPFFVTNNLSIAHCYANIITRFMQDHRNRADYDKTRPFYILELGTGSGKFSFYIMKELIRLKSSLNLHDIQFIYVMTDFTDSNINFWKEHPNLKDFCDMGVLDFAKFNIENQEEIELINSREILKKSETGNPVIVISNYVFDSVPHDVFSFEDDSVKIGKIFQSPKMPETDKKNDYMTLKKSTGFSYNYINDPYYDDYIVNDVIVKYKKTIKSGSVWLPVGAFNCIRNIQKMSNDRLLLICSDKGSYKSYLYDKEYVPTITFHQSCFSISVNFNALEKFFKLLGGDCRHQSYHSNYISMNTSLFLLGENFDDLPETRTAAHEYLDVFYFGDLYGIFNHIEDTRDECSLDSMFSLLKITNWDPDVYKRLIDVILRIKDTDPWPVDTIKELRNAIPNIAKNVYFLPEENDPFSSLGMFFQEGKDLKEAIRYFRMSVEYFGPKDNVLFYIGLCHYYLNELDEALKKFHETVEVNPENILARGWIAQIEFMKMQSR